jgi:hypothetical protein
MLPDLPPDLDRLGNALTHAVARRAAAGHRAALRRRLAASMVAGLLVFAAMTPSHLGRADRANFFSFASADKAEAAVFCDVPRGAGGKNFQLLEPCVPRHPAPQAAR